MFYSPLRYPGGKGKLEPFMELLIKQTGHQGGVSVEPFAGGAGIALELLEKAFVYFDPPYFGKGKQLYLNFFSYDDHVRIERMIDNQVNCDWVITYDDVQEIADIYQNHILKRFDLNYSAAVKRKASEIIIFKRQDMIPTNDQLEQNGICVNLR